MEPLPEDEVVEPLDTDELTEEQLKEMFEKWTDGGVVPVPVHLEDGGAEDDWDCDIINRSVLSDDFIIEPEAKQESQKTVRDLRDSWNELVDDSDVKAIESPLRMTVADIEKELQDAGITKDQLKKTRLRIKQMRNDGRDTLPIEGIDLSKPKKDKRARKTKKKLHDTELFVVGAYSEKYAYKAVNCSLWDNQGAGSFPLFCKLLVRALRQIPYVWDQDYLWRGGIRGELAEIEQGDLITWKGFMSTSKSPQIANLFIRGREKKDSCIYRIKSQSGRDISPFSKHAYEKEVLLPPYSLLSVQKKECNQDGVMEVHLEELYFWRGGRSVLWVDDDHEKHKHVVESSELSGTNFVLAKSTKEALKFLEFEAGVLLDKTKGEFRVVTSMKRKEEDEYGDIALDKKAGIKLMEELRDKGYKESVLIFVDNVEREQAILDKHGASAEHAILTSDESKLLEFCQFEIKPWKKPKSKGSISKLISKLKGKNQ